MELNVIDNKGKESRKVSFDEATLANKASKSLLHEVVTGFLANQRAGTHSTLTRNQVSGGGSKPWKQKGTGRARSGDNRSPLWRHGGIIFGPKPRDCRQDIPKQKKKLAFQMAVDGLIKDSRLQVVEPIVVKEAKTKFVAEIYAKWKAPTDSLFVLDKIDPTFARASRNVENVSVVTVESLNTYECLKARRIFITPEALEKLSARIAKKEA